MLNVVMIKEFEGNSNFKNNSNGNDTDGDSNDDCCDNVGGATNVDGRKYDDKANVDSCDNDGSDNENDSFSGKYFKFDFASISTLFYANLAFLNLPGF